MKQGLFISVEGIDGVGKSTHIDFIAQYLRSHGKDVVTVREPGGTETGEKIRDLLLHSHGMHKITELLLMFASRQELINHVVIPNLNAGICVLSDRFVDASIAYQGVGRNIGVNVVQQLINILEPNVATDLTLLFDTTLSIAMNRLNRSRNKDRIENETLTFFENVQQAYHEIAKQEPIRVKIIRTDRDIELTRQEILLHIDKLLNS